LAWHPSPEPAGLPCGGMRSSTAAGTGPGLVRAVPGQEQRERCSFCGKYRPQCTGLAATSAGADGKPARHAAICAECLALCAEIIAERLA
jgi:hypothetical protein